MKRVRPQRVRPRRVYQCCGHVLAVMDELNGVKIKCPFCGREQNVTQETPKILIFTK